MRIVSRLKASGKDFVIVRKDGFYCAIDTKYIGADGRLNANLNGLMMSADRGLGGCIDKARASAAVDALVDEGMARGDAICKVLGLPMDMAKVLN